MSIHYPQDPKIVTFAQAQALMAQSRRRHWSTVLAQGVFDVLHIGHTTYLKDAKAQADLLFVGLEPDASARLNKGSDRPLNPIEERLQLMADLACVDYVFAFEDSAPYGPQASAFYNRRLSQLKPAKLALALGDPLADIRAQNARQLDIEPVVVRGIWRQYSTTKLLAHITH